MFAVAAAFAAAAAYLINNNKYVIVGKTEFNFSVYIFSVNRKMFILEHLENQRIE